MVDGDDVKGSPRTFSLTSSNPEINKTLLEGAGLEKAIAGNQSEITVSFVDQYNNTAEPGKEFKFGLAFLKASNKVPAPRFLPSGLLFTSLLTAHTSPPSSLTSSLTTSLTTSLTSALTTSLTSALTSSGQVAPR